MTQAIYFDCFSGISGDMVLGALLDVGLPLEQLRAALAKLDLSEWTITAGREMRGYLSGIYTRVQVSQQMQHRRLDDIRAIIEGSALSERVKAQSLRVFTLLAEAEGLVHGINAEEVHFHEVGALDAIIDIVGVTAGLELLEIERVFASPLPLGSGWIAAAHGWLPIPAPAVVYLLAQVSAPVLADETPAELVTPTGAALLAGLATFERPALCLSRVGYGLGTRHLERPNALRVWMGQSLQGQSHAKNVAFITPHSHSHKPVNATPMGSAPLRFDEEGRVAWDQMWDTFCDLALVGGPPHRGTLLEPISPAEVAAAAANYERVVTEIERGLRLVTQLPIVRIGSPGWIGLVCPDEEMALWLLRAITAENVAIRREGTILFLPAGPAFRLEEEIKNVITVVAKTHHYWKEHRFA